jgi:hypothetical protein
MATMYENLCGWGRVDKFQNCATMNCQRNITSTLATQLPHKFLYIVAILIHNHFESPNTFTLSSCLS